MHVAATKENIDLLNLLVASEAELNLRNYKHETPLHLAAYSGIIVSPVRSTYGGYYGLVVVTPPHPQTLHRSHDNLKNPYRIASIFYM